MYSQTHLQVQRWNSPSVENQHKPVVLIAAMIIFTLSMPRLRGDKDAGSQDHEDNHSLQLPMNSVVRNMPAVCSRRVLSRWSGQASRVQDTCSSSRNYEWQTRSDKRNLFFDVLLKILFTLYNQNALNEA